MELNYFVTLLAVVIKAMTVHTYYVPDTCTPIADTFITFVQEPCQCQKELILPPQAIELPCGLGFSSAALPIVAAAYNQRFFVDGGPCFDVSETYIPVSSPCSCIKLAAPVGAEYGCLCQPIVL